MHEEATRMVAAESDEGTPSARAARAPGAALSNSARTKRNKVLASLLEHWSGLTRFVAYPEVPMDNNLGENSIRTPVNGRKNYYGSGSICSAQLAAMLFAILQTLVLWGINPRHWLTRYLTACAQNGASAPQDIAPFLPWAMDARRQAELSCPSPSRAPAPAPSEPPCIHDSS
jgi:transposase